MSHLSDETLLAKWLTVDVKDVMWTVYKVELERRGVITRIR
jgi:hypothetical protein